MMAGTIVVQVGQCGNQLGDALFDRLYCEASGSRNNEFSSACFRRFFSTETGGLLVFVSVILF